MSLEAATYISGLDSNNPTSGDSRRQGDDHLRLLKTVLKATFPGATRAFAFPQVGIVENVPYTVLATDDNKTIFVNTSLGSVTITLPAAPAYGGFAVRVVKTTLDANPVYVVVSGGGTINSLNRARCNVAHHEYEFIYTGSGWIRVRKEEAPGVTLSFHGATPPAGFALCFGQTLSGTDAEYPELIAYFGSRTLPDLRGRSEIGKDDMGGVAANRVTLGVSGINGASIGGVGGAQSVVMTQGNMFPHNHGGFTVAAADHQHQIIAPNTRLAAGRAFAGGGDLLGALWQSTGPNELSGLSGAHSHAINLEGSADPINKMPPSIVTNKIMRLC